MQDLAKICGLGENTSLQENTVSVQKKMEVTRNWYELIKTENGKGGKF